ncbi:acetyl-CoA C-acyltransferase [Umboniibacter marinipuniceus]|uniref:Acetyl-CoA C-acetyltransferase/acetyl-CoA acyltransferase n=1 Tax=Umboniibacter marinipuniceus TaxID=569599 RepID=A0A3M0A8C7_9GAMM|nr:acetyl-CoA C-acyltransferase [Umboniibacter marinipuniceus]RMA81343.1 acetyl-CoA C-acetyltransferase/acetyl-CoA acyltransferase [Umboniibacter marinipuniceus]
MSKAYIVDAIRTPGGKRNGSLSSVHPVDLGAFVLDALVDRNGFSAEDIDDVIFGCVTQVGAQANNLARNAVLASKRIPESVPAVTVDRQCGSSQQALHFAAQAVMSGTQDIVIAGGVESMSLVSIGANVADGKAAGHGQPYSATGINTNYGVDWFHQTIGAELIVEHWGLTREEIDAFAVLSHQRAMKARDAGYFNREIVPYVDDAESIDLQQDEGIRDSCSAEGLANLKPISNGAITAGNASQITDGASAVLVMSEAAVKRFGLKPRAVVHTMAIAGDDPIKMLTGPIPATKKLLAKAGMSIQDIDLYEVNEAFAPVPLVWLRELNASLDKLNVNGGGVALGHPLGATGTKLISTLLCELERRKARYGLVAICESGGTANATLIKRVGE